MRKLIVPVLLVAFTAFYAQAQTKIFKEVGEEISSQMKTIRQDNALIGYMVFTQLEKASEDSFNYKVTIMDENLNDIGTVNFRDRDMALQDVSFEQDVLCVAYLKSDYLDGVKINGWKEKKEIKDIQDKDNVIFIQYISLEGKILNTNTIPITINLTTHSDPGPFVTKYKMYGYLLHPVQLKNISNQGFACFYGDGKANNLLVLNMKGDVLFQKKVDQKSPSFYMLTADKDIYLFCQTYYSPNYQILGYSISDTSASLNYTLKDDRSHRLTGLQLENDLITGKPYLAGLLISEKSGDCMGVFTTIVNGVNNSQVKKITTYWNNSPIGSEEEDRNFQKRIEHTTITNAFRDYNGNTCFTASTYFAGCELIKQNADGKLALETNILSERTIGFRPGPSPKADEKNFYRLFNSDTKTSYLVVDDPQNVSIYNLDQKKVLRTIPHKDSGIKTYVYPAKEGYVMISEYNKKEKYTKLSIEAL